MALQAAGVSWVELLGQIRPRAFLGRELSPEVQKLARVARSEPDRRGRDFWEGLMALSPELPPDQQAALMAAATKHGESQVSRTRLPVSEFLVSLRRGAFDGLSPRETTSLSSRVSLSDPQDTGHLVQLDLALPAEIANDSLAFEVISSLNLRGVLFDSGRSYHFFGAQLVTYEMWVAKLATAQLLAPLVDRRWASHSLIDGESALRISTDSEKHKVAHRLVASLIH